MSDLQGEINFVDSVRCERMGLVQFLKHRNKSQELTRIQTTYSVSNIYLFFLRITIMRTEDLIALAIVLQKQGYADGDNGVSYEEALKNAETAVDKLLELSLETGKSVVELAKEYFISISTPNEESNAGENQIQAA